MSIHHQTLSKTQQPSSPFHIPEPHDPLPLIDFWYFPWSSSRYRPCPSTRLHAPCSRYGDCGDHEDYETSIVIRLINLIFLVSLATTRSSIAGWWRPWIVLQCANMDCHTVQTKYIVAAVTQPLRRSRRLSSPCPSSTWEGRRNHLLTSSARPRTRHH